ncbi:hypothetical protein I302_108081 [Kwoniella bestiolae CBS 10118]|uniref:Ribonuclease H2 subunit B n=1 Tax=Kwoniella bestiolae CBS 10118 TaxID=1296100 RepID=A0A1B9FWQ8_9TREE|nr:hypothetical protein I302_07553 [Kwoniella bestiolae CBS 10118]OCF23199.1 hypothetical protein I302_07553 [Kwoniella bestiolae CBS 10118]
MEYISIIKDDVNLSNSHKYLRIPHPRTGQPQLYLPNGESSVMEVIKLNGSQRRSWLIGDNTIDAGNMLIHYPIDPLFLVIPIITALSSTTNGQSFQPLSDLISTASSLPTFSLPEPFTQPTKPGQPSGSGYNRDIEIMLKLKVVKRVFKACCEKKVIPTIPTSSSSSTSSTKQVYYRPSTQIAINHLKKKIEHFSRPEQFEKFDHLVRGLGRDGLLGDEHEELRRLARTQAAIEHLSQWLSREISAQLTESYDFTPLSTHLKNRTAASIAASQVPSSASGKENAQKGTKRKAPATSKGVEALKKVNTNNMAKLTNFFKPKEGKKQ